MHRSARSLRQGRTEQAPRLHVRGHSGQRRPIGDRLPAAASDSPAFRGSWWKGRSRGRSTAAAKPGAITRPTGPPPATADPVRPFPAGQGFLRRLGDGPVRRRGGRGRGSAVCEDRRPPAPSHAIGSTDRAASIPIPALGKKSPRSTPSSTSWRGWNRRSKAPATGNGSTTGSTRSASCGSTARSIAPGPATTRPMKKVKAEKDAAAQRRLARELALPIRKELVAQTAELMKHLLATRHHHRRDGHRDQLAEHDLAPPADRAGQGVGQDSRRRVAGRRHAQQGDLPCPPRLVLPRVRTCLAAGEPLRLTAMVLGAKPTERCGLLAPVGNRPVAQSAAPPRGAGRLSTWSLPAEATKSDLEYYVRVDTDQGSDASLPATAPSLNQSVVVVEQP